MATTPGSIEHRDDAVPVARLRFGQIIGLHADGRVHAVVFGRQFHAGGARVGRDADRDDVLDACFARSREDFGAVGVELRLIQVRVGVEELHRASRLEVKLRRSSATRALPTLVDAAPPVASFCSNSKWPLVIPKASDGQRLGGRREAERVDALFQVANALLRAIDGFLQEEVDSQVVRVGEFDREVAVVGQAARFEDVLADALGQRILPGDDLLDRLHDVLTTRRNVRAGVHADTAGTSARGSPARG